jgi:hypothetical protein
MRLLKVCTRLMQQQQQQQALCQGPLWQQQHQHRINSTQQLLAMLRGRQE